MNIVFNSSPLIFLTRLSLLEKFVASADNFYVPRSVFEEIDVKQDEACQFVKQLIEVNKLQVQSSNLTSLVTSLNQRLGIGESEAIALGIELNADYVLLDDSAARKEARRLCANVKGTLAVVKKLSSEGQFEIENLDEFYQRLVAIDFRVKRSLFDQIFSNDQ